MSKVYVSGVLHPAYILRGQHGKGPAQVLYLKRIFDCIRGTREPRVVSIEEPPPHTLLFPTPHEIAQFFGDSQWKAVAIDIENAGPHLICVGFTQVNLDTGELGGTICVHFRRRGGGLYYSAKNQLEEVVKALDGFFRDDTVAKIFHNGVSHDVPMLEDIGFEVRGRLLDTMLMAHLAYPEFPKGLQWWSTLKFWMPVWKTLTEESVEDEGKA